MVICSILYKSFTRFLHFELIDVSSFNQFLVSTGCKVFSSYFTCMSLLFFLSLFSISLCMSSSIFLCLCICMSLASGCSRRLVVWFFPRHQHAEPAELKPASHQHHRLTDCSFSCTLRSKNDSLSPHAQFQSRADLIGAFGSTPTVNVLSGNLRHWAVKHLATYF